MPWRAPLLVAAGVAGLAMRLLYGRGQPLWLDETFTGVIAGQPTVAGLIHWLTTELTGPFFYAPIWLWAKLAGTSDVALRMPSLLCTLVAPLFVLTRGHRDPLMRLGWAVLLLLWLPAAALASDARPYALLMLLGTVQIAALCVVLRTPTRRAALGWTAATAAIGLTHYPALIPGIVQGLVLIAVHRRAAFRLWPATVPFAILVAWMAVHLPFVLRYAGKVAAECTTLGWAGAARLPTLVVGDDELALLLAVAVAWDLFNRRHRLAPSRPSAEGWTALSGLAGFGLIVTVACVQPAFAPRYLIAATPGLLFGAGWWLAGALRRGAPAAVASIAILLLSAVSVALGSWRDTSLDQRHAFELERPSAWLMKQRPDRVLFMWADRSVEMTPPALDSNLAAVGGFFFTRAGRRPTVTVVRTPAGSDFAAAVRARAGSDPHTVILWLSNVPSADPHRRPDALLRDPAWTCGDWGEALSVAVACRPRIGRVTRS